MNETIDIGDIELNVPESSYNMIFSDKDGKEVGCLYWNDGTMRFKGTAEQSAIVFFDYLKDVLINPYIEKTRKGELSETKTR